MGFSEKNNMLVLTKKLNGEEKCVFRNVTVLYGLLTR